MQFRCTFWSIFATFASFFGFHFPMTRIWHLSIKPPERIKEHVTLFTLYVYLDLFQTER